MGVQISGYNIHLISIHPDQTQAEITTTITEAALKLTARIKVNEELEKISKNYPKGIGLWSNEQYPYEEVLQVIPELDKAIEALTPKQKANVATYKIIIGNWDTRINFDQKRGFLVVHYTSKAQQIIEAINEAWPN